MSLLAIIVDRGVALPINRFAIPKPPGRESQTIVDDY